MIHTYFRSARPGPRRRVSIWGLTLLSLLVPLFAARPAGAFSTRIHIMIANKLRAELVANGGVPLKFGPYTVRFSEADKQALINQPLSFRAGAIGPDNYAFPGMTDPSHAVGQQPYRQCQLLYEAALTEEERAYAMGCFLHGATDAIAHHYVNYMSGETFTLTPITAGRATNYANVVRHILAESMIQKAAFKLDPQAFTIGQLTHTLPKSFIIRAYFDETSPLWQLIAHHAKGKLEAAEAAQPGAALPTIVQSLPIGPADHLILVPAYLSRIEKARQQVRKDMETAIRDMQNPATADGNTLKVTAGADGQMGTSDDKTACTTSCATLYAKYFTYINLLAPRKDAGDRPLPSAFDAISEKLRLDMQGFTAAYVEVMSNLSVKLNAPLTDGGEAIELTQTEIDTLFKPLTDWANQITNIDYDAVIRAVVPSWIISLEQFFQSIGINVSIPNIVRTLLQPVIQPIKDAIKTYAIDKAKLFLNDLTAQYKAQIAAVQGEYEQRLMKAAPVGVSGTFLDRFFDSGLYGYAFNIAAVSLAKHEMILPMAMTAETTSFAERVGNGPASFDTSHTMAWTQPANCEYLRSAVFPFGIDTKGLVSLRGPADAQTLVGQLDADSPVECHDGSLMKFTESPSAASCQMVELDALLAKPQGSVSRGYPPSYSATMPTCLNLSVEGLPEPPAAAGCTCELGSARQSGASALAIAGAALAALLIGLRWSAARRRRAASFGLGLLVLASTAATGCGDGSPTDPFMMEDKQKVLLSALGTSVWSAKVQRDGKERAIELRFDAGSLLWAEIRNPFGPARRRELRVFTVDTDGQTLHSTVITPTDWIDPDKQIGRRDDWTLTVMPGTPRRLIVTRKLTPMVTEEFTEGAWPAPTTGLTATARVFTAGGSVDKAFCTSAANFNDGLYFDFARGKTNTDLIIEDRMAGAKLLKWRDATGQNRFSVTDVPGFADLGGSELSSQSNFFVHYKGTIKHPGGLFQVREADDDVEDGLWIFVGNNVGTNNFFLEVHGFLIPDRTGNTPSMMLPAGDVPVEIIIARCAKQIIDVDAEIILGSGGYQAIGNVASTPEITTTQFPAAL